MADLQDELHSTAEVGPPHAGTSVADPFPAEAYAAAPDVVDQARALLAEHPVADGYGALPRALGRLPWYDLELGENDVETDVPRLREGHVGAVFWTLHLPEDVGADRAPSATLEQLDWARSLIRGHPEALRPARTAGEVIDARNCGRIAVVLGPAAAAALDDSLGVLRVLHALGVRVLTLAGTGWASEAGLTRFGERVIREMNRLGVLADLSGASDATIARALTLSRTPVLCTRSAARALCPHPDNLPDDLLARLGAAKGLCLVPLAAEQTGPALRDVADHLDHVRRVAGPECVGLSGTYDSGAAHPQDLSDTSGYPRLIAELLRRGWPESDLALLTWGNVQRVLRSADFAARAAQERRDPPTATITEGDG
jgi:microsomal dipeptidase-like Zn-dependent dipeptidase